jgi:hypothetical protein
MKLLTKAITKTLPPLYSTQDEPDPLVRVKFFDPTGSWTWYATEASVRLSDGREVSFLEADKIMRDMRSGSSSKSLSVTCDKDNVRDCVSQPFDSNNQASQHIRRNARQAESSLERRDNSEPGVCIHSTTGTSTSNENRLRQASRSELGAEIGEKPSAGGNCASQQPRSSRRQAGESRSNESRRSSASTQQGEYLERRLSKALYESDVIFFGLVDGFEKELGYFSLTELSTFRGRLGLGIERDLYFEPCKLSALR